MLFHCQYKASSLFLASLTELNWSEEKKKKRERLKGRSGLYGINLKEVDGPHVNTVTSPVLMDNHTLGKVSPTDSDWQIEEAVLLQCWMASPHNTRGVIRSCQSNMRYVTMTSLTAREWVGNWNHQEAAAFRKHDMLTCKYVCRVFCVKRLRPYSLCVCVFLWVDVSFSVCAIKVLFLRP